MPKARVLFTSYGLTVDGDQTYHPQGSILDVSDAELERGLACGGLEKVTAAEAKKAAAADAEAPAGDE